jgi:uncharacterized membrane protein
MYQSLPNFYDSDSPVTREIWTRPSLAAEMMDQRSSLLNMKDLPKEYSADYLNNMNQQCIICECFISSSRSDASKGTTFSHLNQRIIRILQKKNKRVHAAIQQKVPYKSIYICLRDLQNVIQERMASLVDEDISQHNLLQEDAMKSMGQFEKDENTWQKQFEEERTLGEKAADLIATFGGSWRFLGSLWVFLFLWIGVNGIMEVFTPFGHHPFDPYPFILLNLFLSCISAFQAPIIMMAQNRQDSRDRAQSNYISTIILRNENQSRHINAKMGKN